MRLRSALLPPGGDEGVDRDKSCPLSACAVKHGGLPVQRTPACLCRENTNPENTLSDRQRHTSSRGSSLRPDDTHLVLRLLPQTRRHTPGPDSLAVYLCNSLYVHGRGYVCAYACVCVCVCAHACVCVCVCTVVYVYCHV